MNSKRTKASQSSNVCADKETRSKKDGRTEKTTMYPIKTLIRPINVITFNT